MTKMQNFFGRVKGNVFQKGEEKCRCVACEDFKMSMIEDFKCKIYLYEV